MNTDNASLVNKLILLVLSLILVCLVLIVVRAYTDRTLERASVADAAQSASTADEPAESSVQISPPPPVRRPTTNQVRSVASAPPLPWSQVDQPVAQSASEPSGSDAATFQSVIGFGAAPGSRVKEVDVLGTNDVEIFGFAALFGTSKPEVPIDLGPNCGRLNRQGVTTRHYVVNSSGKKALLANVFVYISQGLTGHFEAPAKRVLLDQVGCMFEPYVFGLQTGQTLQVRNSDPEFHNIHIMPRLNPEHNIAQSRKGQVNSFVFKKPESFFRIKCDVHPWMFAYGSVVEHPFFSVTDTNGVFRLPSGLPAGRYMLTAAHLKAGTLAQEFDFRPGEPKAFAFQFVVPEATQARNQ